MSDRAGPGPYSPEVLEHFQRPRNLGQLALDEPRVAGGEAGDKASGRLVRLQVAVGEDGRVTRARFKAFGCPATIACASWATEQAVGASLVEVVGLTDECLAKALRLTPQRRPAAEVVVQALRAAVDALQAKLS